MLATLGEFRSLCPSQSDFDDTAATLALSAASMATERYCGRQFALWTGTEYYDGNGYPNLPLLHYPIASVTSVYLDINGGAGQVPGSFAANTLLEVGTNYIFLAEDGFLQMRATTAFWPLSGIGVGSSPWGYPGLVRRGTSWPGWPKI